MPGQVLDFTGYRGTITSDRGCLIVGNREVPLADVDVILLGDHCQWGFGLVHHAVKFDVTVLVCDWTNNPIASLSFPGSNTRIGTRARAQLDLGLSRRKSAWKNIVQSKVKGQARVLQYVGNPREKFLMTLASKVRSGDPENVEGQAAHFYWREVFSTFDPTFVRRQRTRTSINGMLDYGYTVLRGFVNRSIHMAGLQPILGIFHHGRENATPLADDLIEPFRPAIDLTVVKLLERGIYEIDANARRELVGVTRSHLFSNDESVGTSIQGFAQHFANYVEGNVKILRVPRLRSTGNDG